jgi:DNA-binding NarL/FixJ family response regulator
MDGYPTAYVDPVASEASSSSEEWSERMQGQLNGDKLRLLIVEDEGLWRDMLRLAFSTQPRMEVTGTATSKDDLHAVCAASQPDVLLVDVRLDGDTQALAAVHAVKAEWPHIGIVVLAADSDREYLSTNPPPNTPGWSYIIRQSLSDATGLVRAIEAAAAGLVVLDPAILSGRNDAHGPRLGRLTPRQMDVLHLMAKGYSNAAIGRALVLEEKSVENHINAIFSQLVSGRDPSIHPRVRAVITYLQETQKLAAS